LTPRFSSRIAEICGPCVRLNSFVLRLFQRVQVSHLPLISLYFNAIPTFNFSQLPSIILISDALHTFSCRDCSSWVRKKIFQNFCSLTLGPGSMQITRLMRNVSQFFHPGACFWNMRRSFSLFHELIVAIHEHGLVAELHFVFVFFCLKALMLANEMNGALEMSQLSRSTAILNLALTRLVEAGPGPFTTSSTQVPPSEIASCHSFRSRFTAGWVYTCVGTVGVSMLEREKRWGSNLINSFVFILSVDGQTIIESCTQFLSTLLMNYVFKIHWMALGYL
jgi:hypothetical protein